MSIREAHRGLNALGELSTGFEATYCYSWPRERLESLERLFAMKQVLERIETPFDSIRFDSWAPDALRGLDALGSFRGSRTERIHH
jgi:hypothetical protein